MARKKTTRKRKNTRRRKKRSELKSWALLATGLMVGLFVALLVYLKYQTPINPRVARPSPTVSTPTSTPQPEVKTATPVLENKKSKYDFYGSLPSSEVVVPRSSTNQETAIVIQQDKKFSNAYGNYSIQVGSFSKASGADEQKARLTILGYEPSIEKNTLHDGMVVYRVLLGPYADLDAANKVRTLLHSKKFDNSLLKLE